jgi:hypothetical protein
VKALGFLAAMPIVLLLILYLLFVITNIWGQTSPTPTLGDLIDGIRSMPTDWWFWGVLPGCILLAKIIIPGIAGSLKIALLGEETVFDSEQGILLRDGKIAAQIDEIERLEVATFGGYGSEGPSAHYRLAAKLKGKRKFIVARSFNLESIRELAREIVSVTGLRVVQVKPRWFERF